MRKVIQFLLTVAVCGLCYWLYTIIITPVEFDNEKTARDNAVIERLKDIRKAQVAFKTSRGHYAKTFDSLINFVTHDSLVFEIKFGSADDSAAVAEGRVRTEEVLVAVKDTVFNKEYDAEALRFIPFSDNAEFLMDTATIQTESKILVPVFEAKAPYKQYLIDLDRQLLINLIDADKTIGRYPGMKVGSVLSATNNAGNWE